MIVNSFPPPVAKAVGLLLKECIKNERINHGGASYLSQEAV